MTERKRTARATPVAGISWGYTVRWYGGGGIVEVSVNGCPSPGRAIAQAVAMAKIAGYSRRRWWQAHRWWEPDYDLLAEQVGAGFPL